jgi:putative sigma-54 modulation protein
MNIIITARGYKAPDRLKSYISEKISKKDRVYEGVNTMDVILSYEKQIQIAEIRLNTNNKLLIVKEKSDDIFKSIDLALDNIVRQIKRNKEKLREYENKKMADSLVEI